MVTETRTLDDFHEIEIHKNVEVTLVQDTVAYAVVEAGDNLISLIDTKVESGVLRITNRNTCNWVRSYKKEIQVIVHLVRLEMLKHYGSKDVISSNAITAKILDVLNYNSADIHLKVMTEQCYARLMAASGDIYIEGQTVYNYVYGGSLGYVYEKELKNSDCFIDQRGNGDIYVKAGNWLGVKIEDVGNVYYSGDPKLEATITGSGRLIKY